MIDKHKGKKFKNAFMLRINNANTLDLLQSLLDLKVFESANILINKIVDEGIVSFANTYLNKRAKKEKAETAIPSDLQRILKQLEKSTDDLFVMQSVIEFMVASLFNAKVAELNGNAVSSSDLETGLFSDLPEVLAAVKEVIDKFKKK